MTFYLYITSASFCYLPNVDISQHLTQYSIWQSTLYIIWSYRELMPLNTCMYKGHLRKKSFSHPWLAHSDLDNASQGCGFESHIGKEFFILFVCCCCYYYYLFFFFAFLALLAVRLYPYKWNQAWHLSHSQYVHREDDNIAVNGCVVKRYIKLVCNSFK